jgi:hypothetical protein
VVRNEDMAAYLDYVSRHHSPIHPGTAHSRCAGRVPELPTENEAENGQTERRRRTVQRDAVCDDCPWPRASRRLPVAGPEKVWHPIQRSLARISVYRDAIGCKPIAEVLFCPDLTALCR